MRGHSKAIGGLDVLDEALFVAVPELRLVSKYGVGLDMIDPDAARRHGVSIRWTPGVNRQAVAELAICFMVALCRSIVPLATELAAGGWRHPGRPPDLLIHGRHRRLRRPTASRSRASAARSGQP